MKPTFTLILITLITISSCISHDKGIRPKAYVNYQAIIEYPKPTGYVSDFEGILSDTEEHYLDSLIAEYHQTTTNQMALVTVKSIVPYEDINDFTIDLGNYWGVGKGGKDNGLVIAVSDNMLQVRISTGYGTEKILSDELIKQIIDTEMIPFFKEDQYFEGIKNGILVLEEHWK